jgi:hypothetical protein
LLKEEWPEEKRIPIGWCRNNAQRKLVILAGLKRKWPEEKKDSYWLVQNNAQRKLVLLAGLKRKMARREEGFLLAGAK